MSDFHRRDVAGTTISILAESGEVSIHTSMIDDGCSIMTADQARTLAKALIAAADCIDPPSEKVVSCT